LIAKLKVKDKAIAMKLGVVSMVRIEFSVFYNFELICYHNLEHLGDEDFETLKNNSNSRKLGFDGLLFME
jgi:hypothetical protein